MMRFQKIASLFLSDTNEVGLYQAGPTEEIKGEVILCNTSTAAVACSVAWCERGHGDNPAEAQDWIVKGISISGNDTKRVPVVIGAGESIRVQAGTANAIAVTLGGLSKVVI
ncbi:MAG: hypothetical protein AB1457_16350 [Chloroflexota bacterium]